MNARLRMIDANANRAREALRTMEDIARFALDDRGLCESLKGLRHGLGEALRTAGIDEASLLAWRDTPGDVGTAVSTESEGRRGSLRDVAAAAGKRLTEALRVIEECVKIAPPSPPAPASSTAAGASAAARVESLRYAAYEAERRLMTALGGAGDDGGGGAPQWRVCVLITEALCARGGRAWDEVAELAAAGGADCLQLREKALDGGELLRRAERLVRLARAATQTRGEKVWVVINDRPDIALLSGADGVHVGQTDLGVRDVRRLASAGLVVGVSTSNLEEADKAVAAGADVCGVGPMFPTATKHKPVLAGPAYLRAFVERYPRVPHLAIGGVTPGNVGELAAAGCRGVALSRAVCAAERPDEVVRAVRAGLGALPTPS